MNLITDRVVRWIAAAVWMALCLLVGAWLNTGSLT